MQKQKALAWLLCGCLALGGCSSAQTAAGTEDTALADGAGQEMAEAKAGGIADPAALFSDRDLEIGYDADAAIPILLQGEGASCDSSAVFSGEGVVTIAGEGIYLLSGSLEGMVIVQASDSDKVQLVLDGVQIHSPTSAAIYVRSADKVFITTAEGSQNTLSNGGEYTAIDENNIDGVIFSKADLTLNGAGLLAIQAPVGHGVVSKDELTITSGSYEVEAAGHGLSGKDCVAILDGTFVLTTGKDGVHSDNDEDSQKGFVYLGGGSFTVQAQGDGFSASSWLQVDGGEYDVTTGGGSENGETHLQAGFPGGMMAPGQRPQRQEGAEEAAQGGRTPGPGDDGAGLPGQPPEGSAAPGQGEGAGRPEPPEEDQARTGEAGSPATAPAQGQEDDVSSTATDSSKGFKAGDSLMVLGGSFVLDCADDAFHSNGDLALLGGDIQLQTGDDAFHADNDLAISGGSVEITRCYEGLEGLTVTVSGGELSIVASDDGINAAGGSDQSGLAGRGRDQFAAQEGACITITGGTLTIDAGGDGIDSNGDVKISGGMLCVSGSQAGADFALDYDGSATITGGTLIGVGMSGMAQNFGGESTQGAILLTVDSQQAGSTVSIQDAQGQLLASWQAPKAFDTVLISCAGLESGESYTFTAGSAQMQVTLEGLIYGSGGHNAGRGGIDGRGPAA